MKGLLMKDFWVVSKQVRTYIILGVFYVGYSYLMKEATMIITTGALMSVLTAMNSFGYDEKCKWDNFALTMPISRKMIVTGKYLFSLIMCVLTTVICAIIAAIVLFISGNPVNVLQDILVSAGLVVSMVAFVLAIMLPIIFKVGVEKARYAMMAVIIVPTALALFIVNGNFTVPVLDTNLLIVGGIILLILITTISYLLSVKFMTEKEF